MTTLLLLLLLHGLFLAMLLATQGRGRERANGVLAALILAVSLLLLDFYLEASGAVARWPHLRGVLAPIWFAIGPLTYLYIQSFLGHPRHKRHLFLALPALAVLLWNVPYYLKSGVDKLTGATSRVELLGTYSLFWALTGWCAWRSFNAVRAARRSEPERSQAMPWRTAWLGALMVMMLTYTALDLAVTLFFLARGYLPAVTGFASLLLLTSIVYGAGLLVVIPDGLLARTPWPGRSYERSQIPADEAQRYVANLERVMIEEKPWLNDQLRPAELAARLGVTRHDLSQLMSLHLNASFADYVNRHRVEEVKRQLREMGSNKSILDMGHEAGFGSSATFYRAFKKHAGRTPKEFLAAATVSNVEPHGRQSARRRAPTPTPPRRSQRWPRDR